MSVRCDYPEDDGGALPEKIEEWRTDDTCTHAHCIEVAGYYAEWRASRGERESIALARQDIGSENTGDLTDDEMVLIQRRLK